MAKLKVLFVHGGLHHPFLLCAHIFKTITEQTGMFACDLAERDTAFDADLSGYDIVAVYTQGGKLTGKQEKNICDFVASGGGFVGIHSSTASFRENAAFQEMQGTLFAGHDPGTPKFTVNVTDPAHPLARDLRPLTVCDEIYFMEDKAPGNEVFLGAFHQGRTIPMAYTRRHGEGRVFYTANGHDQRVFLSPEWQRLLFRGMLYAAGQWKAMERPIRVGLLGYGGAFNMGKHHAENAAATGGFEVVAVSDLDGARRAQAEAELPGVKTYASQKTMLKNDEVEMVINITPHNAHYATVSEALKAGRHVVVEKPFCITQKEADTMIDLAKKNKVLLSVYQSRRWDHHFLTARRLVQSGVIGRVFETQIDFGGYDHPGTWWRSDKKISGGLMYDWGAHAIDWMLHLIPHKVVGVSGYYQKRKWFMVTNEDHGRIVIRFEDGSVANFSNSQLNAGSNVGWVILGTDGAIRFPFIFDQEATLITVADGSPATTQVKCDPDDWPAYYRNVADHLHHGAPLICKPESSARVIAIIETAEKSSKAGKELPFKDVYFGR